jgi:hypothetical protein
MTSHAPRRGGWSREAQAVHPERRLLLADALRTPGREREARAQERRFEREALSDGHPRTRCTPACGQRAFGTLVAL